jgi:hypothetical protein
MNVIQKHDVGETQAAIHKHNVGEIQSVFPKQIVDFIKEHHVLTLAVANESDIWCSHAFYEFMEDELVFIITSEEKTRHMQIAMASYKSTDFTTGSDTGMNTLAASTLDADFGEALNTVAGAIALETETIGLIRGLQFKAHISKCEESYLSRYRLKYLKRFPYAILKGGDLWLLKLTEVKFTDNRLGFGKKLCWNFLP